MGMAFGVCDRFGIRPAASYRTHQQREEKRGTIAKDDDAKNRVERPSLPAA
jgi:hypothetical protein